MDVYERAADAEGRDRGAVRGVFALAGPCFDA